MEPDDILFDLDTLKKVIRCAALISSIDGVIHDREWEAVQDFGDRHTSADLTAFYEELLVEIGRLPLDEAEMLTCTDTLVEELSLRLDERQKNTTLQLLEHVLITGYPRGTEDAVLFCAFLERLGNQGVSTVTPIG
jgi:hypothetical protein